MKILLTITGTLFVLLSLTTAWGATVYVPGDYSTIQGALNGSAAGDTIIVEAGTYTENIAFSGRQVTLRSEKGPGVTIIDGGFPTGSDYWCTVAFKNGDGADTVLEGFTIINGRQGTVSGGGVFIENSSPTIRNNIIRDNENATGGGICCGATTGACYPVITDNLITGNRASGYTDSNGGGAFFYHSFPKFRNNIVTANSAVFGGGIAFNKCFGQPLVIQNNVIDNNSADWDGGGLFVYRSGVIVTNCTIVDNSHGSSGQIGGVLNVGDLLLDNSILWGNTGLQLDYASPGVPPFVRYCDVEGGSPFPGTGCFDQDPLFVDQAARDYHLTWDSPCRNSGKNNAAGLPGEDFEGDPRVALGTVDVGADEYYYHLYDLGISGGMIHTVIVGKPGMSVKLFLGDWVLTNPITTKHGKLWLPQPAAGKWSGQVASNGTLHLDVPVPSGSLPGDSKPFQALIGPWGDPWTRLSNLLEVTIE
jgi:hypothetical protein